MVTSTYSINPYSVTVNGPYNDFTVYMAVPEVVVSVAGSGMQGPGGDSISNVYLDGNTLHVVTVDHSGNNVTDYTAGTIASSLGNAAVVVTNPVEGDILQHDGTNFVNHSLTTSRLLDIDNSAVTDGSMLIYKTTTNKYTATNTLDNSITISGGTF